MTSRCPGSPRPPRSAAAFAPSRSGNWRLTNTTRSGTDRRLQGRLDRPRSPLSPRPRRVRSPGSPWRRIHGGRYVPIATIPLIPTPLFVVVEHNARERFPEGRASIQQLPEKQASPLVTLKVVLPRTAHRPQDLLAMLGRPLECPPRRPHAAAQMKRSRSIQAVRVIPRAASIRRERSASRCCTAWNDPRGTPN